MLDTQVTTRLSNHLDKVDLLRTIELGLSVELDERDIVLEWVRAVVVFVCDDFFRIEVLHEGAIRVILIA